MSSESEDDCFSHIAQKLQSMKNDYREDQIKTTNLIADLKKKTNNSNAIKDCDLSLNSEPTEELTLDAIIAKNNTRRATRSAKHTANICVDNILPEKASKRKRTKKTGYTSPTAQVVDENTSVLNSNSESVNDSESSASNRRRRGRAEARQAPRRGRGRQSAVNNSNATLRGNTSSPNTSRARGRRRRGQGRRSYCSSEEYEPAMYDLRAALAASAAMMTGHSNPHSDGPIYSVGNTDEYPDQCDDQPLFSSAPKTQNDVILVENEAELDENEELSVKVYWQSAEHVKFSIRRFQKLTQIFDHFAERENVSHDKLFFTYNDKILKSDDTPDSINYSIVKFIDGGIINQSVSSLVKKDGKEEGIKLKFQCQNVKKPFEMNMRPHDKMLVVMMKCAEHLDKPLEKLKFHFDGDLISGKRTAQELDLEGGECIDIGIIS